MQRTHLVAAALAASLLITGCGPKKNPTRTTQPNPPPENMTNVDQRMGELQQRAAELSAVAKQLPGRDEKDDRAKIGQAFDRTSAALTLLGGPTPGGSFRQQLRIVDNVRQQLGAMSASASSDPTVDSGLRASYNALTNVRERLFPNDTRAQQLLDAVRDHVGDLDAVRGPMHSLVVAQVFSSMGTTVETMAAELEGRNAAAGTTAPAR